LGARIDRQRGRLDRGPARRLAEDFDPVPLDDVASVLYLQLTARLAAWRQHEQLGVQRCHGRHGAEGRQFVARCTRAFGYTFGQLDTPVESTLIARLVPSGKLRAINHAISCSIPGEGTDME